MNMRAHSSFSILSMAVVLLTACHGLLDVTNPTMTNEDDIANAAGAKARRGDVVVAFNQAIPFTAAAVAVFTDERWIDAREIITYNYFQALDRRNGTDYVNALGSGSDAILGGLDGIVTKSSIALPGIRAYADSANKGDFLANVFAFRGYAIVEMAEDICPGFPINEVTPTNLPIYSRPYTTDSALAYGIMQLDSAIALVQDSTHFRNLARVVKGRALLDLGRYADAVAAVASVPADFVFTTEATIDNPLWQNPAFWRFIPRQAMSNREGGNGLPFIEANDVARVPSVRTKVARFLDASDTLYTDGKYTSASTPMVVASGIEARLIRAEAALHDNDPTWIDTLNVLRSGVGLPALSAPTTTDAKVDLLYSERAFWLYLTGRRLGDLRRLMRLYGRAPETIFPTGAYPVGGAYGSSTAIPFNFATQSRYNPNITQGCTTP